jgi:hypothetical protein
MRRGTGQGDLIWNRLDQDEQWQLFIESLWRFQYTRKQRPLKDDPALSDVLYDESQGITDFAVKLYLFAQERAIESGKEEVTAAVIRSAAKDKLQLPKPVLDALRRGDYRVLELYEDVYPPLLEGHSLSKANEGNRHPSLTASVKKPANTTPESPPKSEASPVAAAIPNRKQVRRQKGAAQPAVDTRGEISQLAALAAKQNSSVYDLLRQRGHLRPVGEYLPAGGSPEKASLKKG